MQIASIQNEGKKKVEKRETENTEHVVTSLEIPHIDLRTGHALDIENEFTRATEAAWNVIIGSRRDYKEIKCS